MDAERIIRGVLSLSMSVALLSAQTMAQGLPASMPLRVGAPAVPLITADHAQAIYRHLVEAHWVPQTGLFESFPDSQDRKVSQQASLYEQGAMGLLAIRMGDFDRARGIFQFLKRAWETGPQEPGARRGVHGLANFYNAEFGTEGIEKTIHVGPNAWAGLLAARLANADHDEEALRWALDVAYWIANAVPHENGAVAMGPLDDPHGPPWSRIFSTENNLSYDAFLSELLRSPALEKAQRETIARERDHVENWLFNIAFDRRTGRMARGTNPAGVDRIAALDTVTWLMASIGPHRLAAHGIDPDRLMQTAEASFEVTVGGRRGVDATDQAEADFIFNTAHAGEPLSRRPAADRHRLIWFEGLGQYILAWSELADYEKQAGRPLEARRCLEKARRLADACDRASLPRYPARSAYAYATAGNLYRDGWHAPAENSQGPASSLIAGVWRVFAGLGTDPFSGKQIGAVQEVRVAAPRDMRITQRAPAVLYGTSEEMTLRAWQALGRGDLPQAIIQAQAAIQEWSSFAMQLQKKKMAAVGHPIDYSGEAQEKKEIFSYWALNDVGACYFILGKAYDERGDYGNAARSFQQVVNHYSLAQVWDPHGWFWAPLDAITSDYVARDPAHYGSLLPQELADGSLTGKIPN